MVPRGGVRLGTERCHPSEMRRKSSNGGFGQSACLIPVPCRWHQLCHVLGTLVLCLTLCLSFPIALQRGTCQLCHPLLAVPPLSPSRLQPWKRVVFFPVTRQAPLVWSEYAWHRGLASSEGTVAASVTGLPMAVVLGHSEDIQSGDLLPVPHGRGAAVMTVGSGPGLGLQEVCPRLAGCWPLAWCAVPPPVG